MSKKIIFIQSHPIQYNAPLFVEMTKQGINLEVFFLSDDGVRETYDKQFGSSFKWDIPLLEGYRYHFIKNNSRNDSIYSGFLGITNWGIFKKLRNTNPSLVVVPGWYPAGYWMAILAAKIFGHQLALRGEAPFNQEILKRGIVRLFRRIFFQLILFKLIDFAFYIGEQNKQFYLLYGVPLKKLIFTPYSVDNLRFRNFYLENKNKKSLIKLSLSVPLDCTVILYSGKLINKKRPLDLLKAYHLANLDNCFLIFVGEGVLRSQIEEYIFKHNLQDKVLITGFINQAEIPKYYLIADVLVMSSGPGETWGLSVNEAMNFGLKLVVSNIVGCCNDLVIEEKTGWVYEYGNILSLSETLTKAVTSEIMNMDYYFSIIDKFSYNTSINSLRTLTKIL